MRLNDRFSVRDKRADHQRLGQSRHTFQQTMAAAEQRDQQLLDHLLLPDDHLGQLAHDLLAGFPQFADGGRVQLAALRCVARHAWFLVVVCDIYIVLSSPGIA